MDPALNHLPAKYGEFIAQAFDAGVLEPSEEIAHEICIFLLHIRGDRTPRTSILCRRGWLLLRPWRTLS